MAEKMRTIKASCLCGAAKHEITLRSSVFPLQAHLCHCQSCRHMTGALCYTCVALPKEYQASPELISKLQSFQFSKRITQYFCPTCGTIMIASYLPKDDAGAATTAWDVVTGTIEQAEGVFEVEAHLYIEDTLDGGFSDFIHEVHGKVVDRWPRDIGEGERLPPHWVSPTRPQVQRSPEDRLHAHCKCGGVNFWIAPPSMRSALGQAPWPDVLVPFNTVASPPPADQVWWLRAGGTKILGGVCACNSCRLACGTEWVEWAFVPTIDITLDAEGSVPFTRNSGTLRHYRSSSAATRHFCGTCGAMVFWDGDERPNLIDVAVGLLDAPEGARAENWLEWSRKRLSYREDAMPRAESLTLAVEAGLSQHVQKLESGQPE